MYARSKAPKGTVTVDSDKGRLRLCFPRGVFGEKPKYKAFGLEDTPDNRRLAEVKAQQATHDLKYDQFDASLQKYLYRPLAVVEDSNKSKEPLIKEIWNQYVEFKKPEWSPSTLGNQVAQATRHIENLPFQSLNEAIAIRDYLLKELSRDAAKRLIVQLNAASDWAKKSQLIADNPFKGLAMDIKVEKGDEDAHPDPFTVEEMKLIIKAFETNEFSRYKGGCTHSHASYAAYVKFCFYTGCRPSEAIALTWGDIQPNRIVFNKGVVKAGTLGTVPKKGTKTEKRRYFNINSQLRDLIESIRPKEHQNTDLIFNRDGNYLNQGSFRNVWKRVLTKLGIRYRRPYCIRHTFITEQVKKGIVTSAIAKAVGNSPSVIEEYYLGDLSSIAMHEM